MQEHEEVEDQHKKYCKQETKQEQENSQKYETNQEHG